MQCQHYMGPHREGEEPEPPEVVPAVLVPHSNILQTVPHLHILGSLVVLQPAERGVAQGLRSKPSQRFFSEAQST